MKIAMKDYLAAGWHLQLLCERLKRNRWPQEISPISVEKLSRLRLAANPIRGGVHRANLEQLKRRPQRLGHLLKGGKRGLELGRCRMTKQDKIAWQLGTGGPPVSKCRMLAGRQVRFLLKPR